MKLRQIESYAAKSCPWHHHMLLCMSSVIKFASWCFSVAGTGSIVFAKNVDGNIQSLQCSFWQFASNFLNTRINELLSVLQNWCLAHNWGGIGTGETWSAKLDHLQTNWFTVAFECMSWSCFQQHVCPCPISSLSLINTACSCIFRNNFEYKVNPSETSRLKTCVMLISCCKQSYCIHHCSLLVLTCCHGSNKFELWLLAVRMFYNWLHFHLKNSPSKSFFCPFWTPL